MKAFPWGVWSGYETSVVRTSPGCHMISSATSTAVLIFDKHKNQFLGLTQGLPQHYIHHSLIWFMMVCTQKLFTFDTQ